MRLILGLIGLLAVVSLIVNITFSLLLHSSFIKLQKSRTLPVKALAETRKTHIEEFVILGDSRAQMWVGLDEVARQEKLNTVNYAVGGYTSEQVKRQILGNTTLLKNKIVLLQVGINDIHWNGLLSLSERKEITINLKRNIESITTILLSKNNRVILTTVFPPQPPTLIRELYWPRDIIHTIEDINSYIAELGELNGAVILDSHLILKDQHSEYLNPKWNDDEFFLHINRNGYNHLNAELRKVLFKLQQR